jgi:hypothetical protein
MPPKLRSLAKGNISQEGSSPTGTPTVQENDAVFNFPTSSIEEIVEDLNKGSFRIESMGPAILQILSSLKDIARALNQQAITHEELLLENQQQTTTIEKLVSEVNTCKLNNVSLKKDNENLLIKINDLEQYSRNYNLEFQGVPESPNENTYTIVANISSFLGTNLNPGDIEYCHRLGKSVRNPNKPPTIVAKFYSRQVKEAIIAGKKKKKNITAQDVGYQTSTNKIYVNEHLTAANKNLFWLARNVADFKFAWTRFGKVFIKKDEQSPVIRISKPADLPV